MRRGKKKRETEIEKEYRTTYRFECPKRGWVEQEVIVRRYKPKKTESEQVYFEYSFLEEEVQDALKEEE